MRGDMSIPLQFAYLYDRQVFMWSDCLLDLGTNFLVGNMVFVRCEVSCGSTSFPWLVFSFGALLWGSMIQKHRGRLMWQGSVSVVFCNWEKYTCHSKLVSTLSVMLLSVLISYNWAQVLEACDCLKLLSVHFDLCVDATGCWCQTVKSCWCHQLGLLGTDLHAYTIQLCIPSLHDTVLHTSPTKYSFTFLACKI